MCMAHSLALKLAANTLQFFYSCSHLFFNCLFQSIFKIICIQESVHMAHIWYHKTIQAIVNGKP